MTWDRLRSSYDRVARRYEETFVDELVAKPHDRELLDRMAATVDGPALEVGSGPGQIGAYLQRLGLRVIATDLSPEMARLAARRLGIAAIADLRALPFADGSVGAVIGFYCLIHIRRAELGPTLVELGRVLRPGGRLLVSVHEGDGELSVDQFLGEAVPFIATLFTLDELVGATRAAGLEVILAERRPPYEGEHPTVRLYVEARRRANARP